MDIAPRLSAADPSALRIALRNDLPAEAFEPQPWRGAVALGELALMLAIGAGLKRFVLPWYAGLLAALVLGQLVVSVSLVLGHENLHHAIFQNRVWRSVTSAIGVSFFLLTPATWKAWHVNTHHAKTNAYGRDPECMPTLEAWRESRMVRFIHATMPGSRTLVSFVAFFVYFAAQGQLFLWYYLEEPGFQSLRFERARERIKTLLLIGGWVALGVWLGPRTSLYALIIPMLTANFTLLCYISTQHWLCPSTPEVNNPFVNTISQTVHPMIDWMHWNFSYHQEHHIFPGMSHRFLPLVRASLKRIHPAASAVHPLWRALIAIYRKPALYLDPETLVRPDGSGRMPISEVALLLAPQPPDRRA